MRPPSVAVDSARDSIRVADDVGQRLLTDPEERGLAAASSGPTRWLEAHAIP